MDPSEKRSRQRRHRNIPPPSPDNSNDIDQQQQRRRVLDSFLDDLPRDSPPPFPEQMNPLEAFLASTMRADGPRGRDKSRWLHVLRNHLRSPPSPGVASPVVDRARQTQELSSVVNEMSDWLIMQGEDNVMGFDPAQYTPLLVRLVKGSDEFGPHLAHLSLRCITNMLDVIPSSSNVVVANGGADACVDKLASIEYVDVAEQAIAALVKISRSDASAVLHANGPSAVLSFIDFFAGAVQQDCLAVSVNCSKDLGIEDIPYMYGCADVLVNLLTYADHRLVEGAITTLSRIFSTFRGSWCGETLELMEKFVKPNLVPHLMQVLRAPNEITQGHAIQILDILDVLMLGDANQPSKMLEAGLGDFLYAAVSRFVSGSMMSSPAGYIATSGNSTPAPAPTPHYLAAALACAQSLLPPVPVDINDQCTYMYLYTSRVALMDSVENVADEDECKSRISMMKRDKDAFHTFACKLLPLISSLYKEKTMPSISRRMISIMGRMMYHSTARDAESLANLVPLSRLLSTMLSSTDNIVVSRAILLVCVLIDKVGVKVINDLKRNGVLSDVVRLVNGGTLDMKSAWISEHVNTLSVKTRDDSDDIPQYLQVATALCEYLKAGPRESKSGLRIWSGTSGYHVPKKLEEFYYEISDVPSGNVSLDSFTGCCLVGLRDILEGTDKYEKKVKITSHTLDVLSGHHPTLHDNDITTAMTADIIPKCPKSADDDSLEVGATGLSSYEASKINLASSLLSFLDPRSTSHVLTYTIRANAFLNAFASSKRGGLNPLINTLLDTLGRTEQCPLKIHLAPSQSGSDISTRLRTLVTPIKLKIVPGSAEFVHTLVDYLKRNNKLPRRIRIDKMDIDAPVTGSQYSARSASEGDNKRTLIKTEGSLPEVIISMPSYQAMVEPSCSVESICNFLIRRVVRVINQAISPEQNEHEGMEEMLRRLARAIGADEDDVLDDDDDVDELEDGVLVTMPFIRLRMNGVELPPYLPLLHAIESHSTDDIWSQEWTMTYDGLPDLMGCVEHGIRRPSKPKRRREKLYESVELHPDLSTLAPDTTDTTSPYAFCYTAASSPPLVICDVAPAIVKPNELPDEAQVILRLIRSLHFLMTARSVGLADSSSTNNSISFVDAGLDSKVRRQLQDPLTITTADFPDYMICLMHAYPFLFSLDARKLYFTAGALGRARALLLIQERTIDSSAPTSAGDQELRVARVPRQKVVVKRGQWLDAISSVNDESAKHPKAVIEVVFDGEIGTGSGPTLEFFSSASRAYYSVDMNLWRCNNDERIEHQGLMYVNAPQGLYPRPIRKCLPSNIAAHNESSGTFGSLPEVYDEQPRDRNYDLVLRHFESMGRFVGRAVLDTRLVDLPLNPVFIRLVLGRPVVYQHLKYVDKSLYDNLARVDGTAGLEFTMPGDEEYELKPDGQSISVTDDNVTEYRDLVAMHLLHDGVMPQAIAFRKGLSSVVDIRWLDLFDEQELLAMIVGDITPWAIEDLQAHTKCDHGFTHSSLSVIRFFRILSSFDQKQRQSFIRFITGSPRLPLGGLAALRPQLTIVKKDPEAPNAPDAYLVSVMTCANYIKLPDYSSEEVMRARLLTAMSEGADAFCLS